MTAAVVKKESNFFSDVGNFVSNGITSAKEVATDVGIWVAGVPRKVSEGVKGIFGYYTIPSLGSYEEFAADAEIAPAIKLHLIDIVAYATSTNRLGESMNLNDSLYERVKEEALEKLGGDSMKLRVVQSVVGEYLGVFCAKLDAFKLSSVEYSMTRFKAIEYFTTTVLDGDTSNMKSMLAEFGKQKNNVVKFAEFVGTAINATKLPVQTVETVVNDAVEETVAEAVANAAEAVAEAAEVVEEAENMSSTMHIENDTVVVKTAIAEEDNAEEVTVVSTAKIGDDKVTEAYVVSNDASSTVVDTEATIADDELPPEALATVKMIEAMIADGSLNKEKFVSDKRYRKSMSKVITAKILKECGVDKNDTATKGHIEEILSTAFEEMADA